MLGVNYQMGTTFVAMLAKGYQKEPWLSRFQSVVLELSQTEA
jgi:hypothetical protein